MYPIDLPSSYWSVINAIELVQEGLCLVRLSNTWILEKIFYFLSKCSTSSTMISLEHICVCDISINNPAFGSKNTKQCAIWVNDQVWEALEHWPPLILHPVGNICFPGSWERRKYYNKCEYIRLQIGQTLIWNWEEMREIYFNFGAK